MFSMILPKPIPLIIKVVFSMVSISLYPAKEMKNALIMTVNLNESIETTYGKANLAANQAYPSIDIGLPW